MAGDIFNARFINCHFNETILPTLRGEKVDPIIKEVELIWNAMQLAIYDPIMNASE